MLINTGLEKDTMLCLWSGRRMCGGLEVQVNGSLSENPQCITQPRGPQTAKHHLFFQTRRTQHVQTVQRLRQRLPTTVHTTNGLLGIVIKTSTQLCPAAPADPPASTNSRALRAHDCRDRRGALQPTRSGQASPSPANKTQSVARPLRPPRSTHARQPSADTRDVRH